MKSMHKINIQLVALIAVAIIVSCSPNIKDMSYPESKKIEFSENLHGFEVEDSYRWLEDFTSEESVDWVERQNAFTKEFIGKNSYKKSIAKDLKKIWGN